MTHDDTSNAWDPEHDDTEWWKEDHPIAGGADRRGQRRVVTIVGLLTVLGFGAATVVSTGGSERPAVTTPPAVTVATTSVPALDA